MNASCNNWRDRNLSARIVEVLSASHEGFLCSVTCTHTGALEYVLGFGPLQGTLLRTAVARAYPGHGIDVIVSRGMSYTPPHQDSHTTVLVLARLNSMDSVVLLPYYLVQHDTLTLGQVTSWWEGIIDLEEHLPMDSRILPSQQRYKPGPIEGPLPVDNKGVEWSLANFQAFQRCWEDVADAFVSWISDQGVPIQVRDPHSPHHHPHHHHHQKIIII